MKELTPRQKEQRARVLAGTRELLAEQGYDGLQMRVLAERCGVSTMTLYNRFGNKDDLILVALQELLGSLAAETNASGKRGIEELLDLASRTADQILATPQYAQAMASMLFNAQPDSPICQTLLVAVIDESRNFIEQMLKLGELNNSVDTELLVRNLGVCRWSAILLWMKQIHTDAEFKAQYVCAPILTLAPAMTPKTRAIYAPKLAKLSL